VEKGLIVEGIERLAACDAKTYNSFDGQISSLRGHVGHRRLRGRRVLGRERGVLRSSAARSLRRARFRSYVFRVATVARADLILSWNFQHIVNFNRIHKFKGVNLQNGYPPVEIYSPMELRYDDQE